jgi:hypothetical protein
MNLFEQQQSREVTPEVVPAKLISIAGIPVPPLFAPDPRTAKRFAEFFGANIRNPNTRRAYLGALETFSAWCGATGRSRQKITSLGRKTGSQAIVLTGVIP